MKTWIKPAAAAENYLVNQSVSNGPCIAIACMVDAANAYENSKGLLGSGGYNRDHQAFVCHTVGDTVNGGCGTAANNAIIVQNGKVTGMKEIHNQTGINELNCTMYTDGSYQHRAINVDYAPNNMIYWTTEANYVDRGMTITRVWHHQGLMQSTGTSNHS